MTKELFANETKFYKEHIYTAEGVDMVRQSVEYQKEWNSIGGDIKFGTYGVKLNLIHQELREKIQKIEIIPIGLNNQCHWNTDIFKKCGYTIELGFNLTACPCGRRQTYEIHSVNKKDGVYFDFTKDFNNEKQKYFLPLDTKSHALKYIYVYGKKPFSINRGCKCNMTWIKNPNVNETTQGEFMEHCESVKNNLDRIIVYN